MDVNQLNIDLALTPTDHLQLRQCQDGGMAIHDAWTKKVAAAFSISTASGLFALAATKPDTPLCPSFSFWRDFASLYLTQLCRTPEVATKKLDPIEPPSISELGTLVLSSPPMQGGEYLSTAVFETLWNELDTWVRSEVAASKGGLTEWLKQHAAIWRQVGRVCFHLAENKRDPQAPFAFLATYAPRLTKTSRVQYQPLGAALGEYAGQRNKNALIKLLSPVQRAAEQIDFVRELVDSGDIFHPLAWTAKEAHSLLKNVHLLQESGLLVKLPDWWRKRARPQVTVTLGEKKQSRFGTNGLIDFNVGIALGNEKLTQKDWRELMASDESLAFIKGQWVEVDKEKLAAALKHWKQVQATAKQDGISFIEGMRLLAGAPTDLDADDSLANPDHEWAFIDSGKWLSKVLTNLRDPAGKNKTAQTPSGKLRGSFRGSLRHYQQTGHDWMQLLSNLGLGACLADDMGLGKTIQILSLLLTLKEEKKTPTKPSILVLPASLLANWKTELKRFTPTLRAAFIHLSETPATDISALARNPKTLAKTDLVLTTYGMLLRQKWLLDIDWHLAILDEAQAIKNPATRQTKAVKQLKAHSRIALTGTPVENRLGDLWSLFDFICPGLLGSTTQFKQFIKNMEANEHDQYAPLRNLIQPYVLRRLKTDRRIISDLPDKTEMKVFCGLSKQQAALYAKSVDQFAQALEELGGIQRRGLVLNYLIKFKQICNHPSQFLGDGAYQPNRSGKLERLKIICEEIAARQEKLLVFTQFREMTEPIATFLTDIFGRQGLTLHGGTAVRKRKALVDAFQREDGPPFFVLSLKAGGTGLNLTAASHVVHFDRWWNPAVENQATDRAFRIGQHRNVVVHKFICRGTIEEKIDAMLEDKTNLADGVLKSGTETMLTEMSNDELLKAVALDINRAEL